MITFPGQDIDFVIAGEALQSGANQAENSGRSRQPPEILRDLPGSRGEIRQQGQGGEPAGATASQTEEGGAACWSNHCGGHLATLLLLSITITLPLLLLLAAAGQVVPGPALLSADSSESGETGQSSPGPAQPAGSHTANHRVRGLRPPAALKPLPAGHRGEEQQSLLPPAASRLLPSNSSTSSPTAVQLGPSKLPSLVLYANTLSEHWNSVDYDGHITAWTECCTVCFQH